MRLRRFEYHTPRSLEEACRLLAEHSESASILAGGTDLLVDLKEETIFWDHLVSLKNITEVRGISFNVDTGLRIGASATLNAVARSEIVKRHYPGLAEAAGSVGGTQIRNRGTIGGNVCSAVPSADIPPILLTLDAKLTLISTEGECVLPASDFFTGPRETVRKPSEILVNVIVPPPEEGSGSCYLKFGLRDSSALAVVGVAAAVIMQDDRCLSGKIALGAVSPTPVLAQKASAELKDVVVTKDLAMKLGAIAREECKPISDIRGSEKYRRDLVQTLTSRALLTAVERAKSNGSN